MNRKAAKYFITYFSETTGKRESTIVSAFSGEQAQEIFLESHDPLLFRILNTREGI